MVWLVSVMGVVERSFRCICVECADDEECKKMIAFALSNRLASKKVYTVFFFVREDQTSLKYITRPLITSRVSAITSYSFAVLGSLVLLRRIIVDIIAHTNVNVHSPVTIHSFTRKISVFCT